MSVGAPSLALIRLAREALAAGIFHRLRLLVTWSSQLPSLTSTTIATRPEASTIALGRIIDIRSHRWWRPCSSWPKPHYRLSAFILGRCVSKANSKSLLDLTTYRSAKYPLLLILQTHLPFDPLRRRLFSNQQLRSPALSPTMTAAPPLPASKPSPSSAVLLTDRLEKPSVDDRDYRVVQLPNKLEVLLVHDPETDKASAALDVNVGNFSDETDMPGMAHAVEHVRTSIAIYLE